MRKVVALFVVVGAFVAPSAAVAVERLRVESMGPARGAVGTDDRYAVWSVAETLVRVVDTKDSTGREVEVDCPAVQFGGSKLLSSCGQVTNVRTGARGTVRHQTPVGATFSWLDIGSDWALGYVSTDDGSHIDYTSLANGSVKLGPGTRSVVPDLDNPDLWAHLCSPLARRRTSDPNASNRPYAPYTYDKPYGLTNTESGLVLERCGTRRKVKLTRIMVAYELLNGIAAWEDGRFVYVRNLKSGRTYTWAGPPGTTPRVALTNNRIFISDGSRVVAADRPR